MHADTKIIVALDYARDTDALAFADRIDPKLARLKVGKEMFTRFGPVFVTRLQSAGFEVFLDLKFHDIPNTVAQAVKAAADLGVWMVNVHASGGARMMSAAREALEEFDARRPLLIAVTVLTSMTQEEMTALGETGTIAERVSRLAELAAQSGLDGVVCSAQEAAGLKRERGPHFRLVTPGIRPAGSELGDQRRVMTPLEAVRAGSDYLVIGRPITQAAEPLKVLKSIQDELAGL
ncbi:MAG: orotidine-5'-phosphate decarboxylase [Gammaproteobacteria bacterium]|nr:orotidine-5'-phosphate decarboxylase [Gammaproteobacteria bacterium]